VTPEIRKLRDIALSYPGVEEGVACEGTALEKRTIKARKKAFVFLGVADVMLKLGPLVDEAMALATAEPGRCKVGAHGWVTVQLDESSESEQLARWLDESYRLVVKPRA
jgi:predicted DNA-binding protein (MmcQ/YjbR family)